MSRQRGPYSRLIYVSLFDLIYAQCGKTEINALASVYNNNIIVISIIYGRYMYKVSRIGGVYQFFYLLDGVGGARVKRFTINTAVMRIM